MRIPVSSRCVPGHDPAPGSHGRAHCDDGVDGHGVSRVSFMTEQGAVIVGSVILDNSQQRYVKFRGAGRVPALSIFDRSVSQSSVCETLGKCRVSRHFLYLNPYLILRKSDLVGFNCVPPCVASIPGTSSRASRPDVVRDDEEQAKRLCQSGFPQDSAELYVPLLGSTHPFPLGLSLPWLAHRVGSVGRPLEIIPDHRDRATPCEYLNWRSRSSSSSSRVPLPCKPNLLECQHRRPRRWASAVSKTSWAA
jgi:hypothetical protein